MLNEVEIKDLMPGYQAGLLLNPMSFQKAGSTLGQRRRRWPNVEPAFLFNNWRTRSSSI